MATQNPTLRVGAIDNAAAGPMPQPPPRLRDAQPNLEVETIEQKIIRLLPRILSGSLDVAIIRAPEARDSRLEFHPLFLETAVVAVPEDHLLAVKKGIAVHDMAEEPSIVPDRRSRPHSHDLTMKLFLMLVRPHVWRRLPKKSRRSSVLLALVWGWRLCRNEPLALRLAVLPLLIWRFQMGRPRASWGCRRSGCATHEIPCATPLSRSSPRTSTF